MRYYFFVQELVEGKISIHYVAKSESQLVDLGTKYLSKHRHRNVVISLRYEFLTIFSVLCSYLQRCTYTTLLFLIW